MDGRRKLEIAGWALAAFVVVLVGTRLLRGGGGDPVPVTVAAGGGAPAATASAPSRPAGAGLLVVDVEGEVARPGVQRVPAGSRAEVAVRQAGGLTRRGDAAAVNLAAPLHDGEQVVVPRRGTVATPGAADPTGAAPAGGDQPAAPPGGAPAQPVSLSTATAAQLDALDGIGPTLAARIVAYRQAHGGFRSVEELKQVEGIGDKRFAALKAAVTP